MNKLLVLSGDIPNILYVVLCSDKLIAVIKLVQTCQPQCTIATSITVANSVNSCVQWYCGIERCMARMD